MHIRRITAAAVLAAMGALGGCGADEPGEPNATDDSTAYRENTADQAPAPESTVPGTQETTPSGAVAGSDTDRATQPGQSLEGTTRPGTASEEVAMTEFAALDTNSDGKLAESEWQQDVLEGLEFEQIDEDASGDIDRDEFRQAVAMSGMPESTEPQSPEDDDPTTP